MQSDTIDNVQVGDDNMYMYMNIYMNSDIMWSNTIFNVQACDNNDSAALQLTLKCDILCINFTNAYNEGSHLRDLDMISTKGNYMCEGHSKLNYKATQH